MSTSLSKAIAISAIGWQKMLSESCSLEKALEVCLAGQPNEMKGVVQSLLYTTVRHRAKVELLLGKLVKSRPKKIQKLYCTSRWRYFLKEKKRHLQSSIRLSMPLR